MNVLTAARCARLHVAAAARADFAATLEQLGARGAAHRLPAGHGRRPGGASRSARRRRSGRERARAARAARSSRCARSSRRRCSTACAASSKRARTTTSCSCRRQSARRCCRSSPNGAPGAPRSFTGRDVMQAYGQVMAMREAAVAATAALRFRPLSDLADPALRGRAAPRRATTRATHCRTSRSPWPYNMSEQPAASVNWRRARTACRSACSWSGSASTMRACCALPPHRGAAPGATALAGLSVTRRSGRPATRPLRRERR